MASATRHALRTVMCVGVRASVCVCALVCACTFMHAAVHACEAAMRVRAAMRGCALAVVRRWCPSTRGPMQASFRM
eukprot:231145-Chlamydomonas_euryale.AAC.1